MDLSYKAFIQLIKGASDTPREQKACPVTKTLNVIQGKWKSHILFFLFL